MRDPSAVVRGCELEESKNGLMDAEAVSVQGIVWRKGSRDFGACRNHVVLRGSGGILLSSAEKKPLPKCASSERISVETTRLPNYRIIYRSSLPIGPIIRTNRYKWNSAFARLHSAKCNSSFLLVPPSLQHPKGPLDSLDFCALSTVTLTLQFFLFLSHLTRGQQA